MQLALPRPRRLLLAFLSALFVLSVPSCRPSETVEGQARDAKIKTEIKSKLASDVGAATLTSVSVNVTNGVVTLAGPVHSDAEKSRVESIARSVEGVASVNDALQVQGGVPVAPSGMTSAPAGPLPTAIPTPPS